jgi:hypothetical protein
MARPFLRNYRNFRLALLNSIPVKIGNDANQKKGTALLRASISPFALPIVPRA